MKKRVSSRGPWIALATERSALTLSHKPSRTPAPAEAASKLPGVPIFYIYLVVPFGSLLWLIQLLRKQSRPGSAPADMPDVGGGPVVGVDERHRAIETGGA